MINILNEIWKFGLSDDNASKEVDGNLILWTLRQERDLALHSSSNS